MYSQLIYLQPTGNLLKPTIDERIKHNASISNRPTLIHSISSTRFSHQELFQPHRICRNTPATQHHCQQPGHYSIRGNEIK